MTIREKQRRRRVLVVSSFFPPHAIGGAEVVALRQAKLMQARGWDVLVFAGAQPKPKVVGRRSCRRDLVEGIEVRRIMRREYRGPGDIDFLDDGIERRFDRVLREWQPDVVHMHNLQGLSAALIPIAKQRGARVLITLHDRWGFCVKSVLLRNDFATCGDHEDCHLCQPTVRSRDGCLPIRFRRDFVMSCFRQADVAIAPSRQIAADYARAGLGDDKLVVLSSGIDLGAIEPRLREPHDVVQLLCSAYLSEHKGIRELMQALRILWSRVEHRHRWILRVAGSGHLESFLRQAIAEDGMEDAVVLLGRVPRSEVLAHLRDSDLVVLSSLCAENEPVCLLEGIASGAALLGARVGGIPDLIEDGVNGRLYDPRDPLALARTLEDLIQNPTMLQAFSKANLALRRRYDEGLTGDRLVALYEAEHVQAPTIAEVAVECGPGAPTADDIERVQHAPSHVDGRRVRLLWWTWHRCRAAERFSASWRMGRRRTIGWILRPSRNKPDFAVMIDRGRISEAEA